MELKTIKNKNLFLLFLQILYLFFHINECMMLFINLA